MMKTFHRGSKQNLKMMDLFTGIAGFTRAGEMTGKIDSILGSEIDSFNVKFLDQKIGLDNCGDISNLAVPLSEHPHASYADDDLVAVEETGFTTVSIEDFYEGAIEFPDILCGGFPCQNISPANCHDSSGIQGDKSGLVHEQLRVIELLEPSYCIMENSEQLTNKGLDFILNELQKLGYVVEFECVSAAHFGFPFYRHRQYLVAYLPSTPLAKHGKSVFSVLRKEACKAPNSKFPFKHEASDEFIESAIVLNPRQIKLRTKRLNSLGNSIIPCIAKAIFDAIVIAEFGKVDSLEDVLLTEYSGSLVGESWVNIIGLFEKKVKPFKVPSRGYMNGSTLYTGPRDSMVNPLKTTYQGMWQTLIARDGNNNFTTKSRLNRPGGLGGLVGEFMKLGINDGGLSPVFSEEFMGYPKGWTELRSN
ncbi:DNA cytosine methyltransferase [Vibrio harveyi]|uniref:DNA cytosine methyltransferase n=1 Tax=Vibrio harveyi TaxID=669 RepID=UPI0008417002|nr:DNA cytosine methyltransferase [Vibrio harveyi]ODM56024.1 hypothetical protein BC455_22770 [Vibrio harveyi]